jgi:opacity protein-like surface antigen
MLFRFFKEAFSFDLDPSIFIGMTKRDAGLGNKEYLAVPATFMYAVTSKLGLAAQLGLWLPLRETSFTMFGVSLGAQYFITDQLILDAAFSLPAVMGGSAVPDGVDLRTLTLGVAYAF